MRVIQAVLAVFFGVASHLFIYASGIALRFGDLFFLVAAVCAAACLLTLWDLWRSGNGK